MAERVTIPVRVIPRAGADRVDVMRAGRLVIRVSAAPEAGAANAAARAVLASALGLRTTDVRLERGSTSRDKELSIPTYAKAALAEISTSKSAPGVARRRESLAKRGFPGAPVPRPLGGRGALGRVRGASDPGAGTGPPARSLGDGLK